MMSSRLKAQLEKITGQTVLLLPNGEIDRKKLDHQLVYYQVMSVEPIIDKSQKETRNCNRFLAEQGISNAENDLSNQYKRKVEYFTTRTFPYLQNRVSIVNNVEILLQPIENAIELVQTRCDQLVIQIENNPPRINPLQQIIQGSVFPMVNEGPLKICELFLGSNREKYDPALTSKLESSMVRFLKLCGDAISLSRTLIGPEHVRFQQMMEAQFVTLQEHAAIYIQNNNNNSNNKIK